MKNPTLVYAQSALRDLYRGKLKSSGITEKQAEKLGYSCVTAEEAAQQGFQKRGALKLPYYTISGNPTEFFRLRYLEPARGILTEKSDQRYDQPKKSLNELYIPPNINWDIYLKDKSLPLVITEGELKAAKACLMGLHCVAIGGVWNFKAKKWGVAFLEEFETLSLRDREVYVVFDSDANQNPNIYLATNALSRMLMGLKARPKIGRLPSVTETGKTGLDDYFLARELEDFRAQVIREAKSFGPMEDILQFNEEAVFVRKLAKVYSYREKEFFTKAEFSLLYGNRIRLVQVGDGNGARTKEVLIAEEWLRSSFRSEVDRVDYAPGKPRFSEGTVNTWSGWGCESEPGDVKLFLQLVEHLCQGEKEEARHWLIQWLAYPVQNPGAKLFSALFFWSAETGTGKTLLGHTMRRIYGENFIELTSDMLLNERNSFIRDKQFVLGDELRGETSASKVTDKLKSMITGETVGYNPKNVKEFQLKNVINWMFTSQWAGSMKIEGYDRRMFVLNPEEKLPKAFADKYDAWYREEDGPGPGAAHIRYFLENYDLTGFEPRGAAFVTYAKGQTIEDERNDLEAALEQLKCDPDSVLREPSDGLGGTAPTIYPYSLWRAEDFRALVDPTLDKRKYSVKFIGGQLKRAGFKRVAGGQGCFTHAGQVKLWLLRPLPLTVKNWKNWAPTEWGAYYNKERSLMQATIHEPKKRKF